MSEFRARIGRVRMKNGGADVVVFDRKPVNLDGEDYRGTIVANARRIAESATPAKDLVGYVVLGIFHDGTMSLGYRYDFDRAPIPRMMLPSWIAERIRSDLINEPDARAVFDEMFEWVER